MSTELWTDESFDQPTNKEYPLGPAYQAAVRANDQRKKEELRAIFDSRATRSDKGRVRIMKCNRCGETLNNAKIVITTTGLNGKKAGERKRYCSQKCFDKSYRKGLSRLLPI
jgi:hypothetical protein